MSSYDYFGGEESDNSAVIGGDDMSNFTNGFDMSADITALVHGGLQDILNACHAQVYGGDDSESDGGDDSESDSEDSESEDKAGGDKGRDENDTLTTGGNCHGINEENDEVESYGGDYSSDFSDTDESDESDDEKPSVSGGLISSSDFFNSDGGEITGGEITGGYAGVIYN